MPMNYEPNTTKWEIGDIVIHDADAKNERMLMRVIGYEDNGKLITEYIKFESPDKTYTNRIEVLHAPSLFGILTTHAGTPRSITVEGYEMKPAKVAPRGNSSHVMCPASWVGCDVVVIRVSER